MGHFTLFSFQCCTDKRFQSPSYHRDYCVFVYSMGPEFLHIHKLNVNLLSFLMTCTNSFTCGKVTGTSFLACWLHLMRSVW